MRIKTVCDYCRSNDIEYLGNDMCFCNACRAERKAKDIAVETPYERTRNAVYATGNRWAIENFKNTH